MIGNPQQARAQLDTLTGLADFIKLVIDKPANVKAVLAEMRDDVAAVISATEAARALHAETQALRAGLDDGLAEMAAGRAKLASEVAAFAESMRMQSTGWAREMAEVVTGRDALIAADHILREQKSAVAVAAMAAQQRNEEATIALSRANELKAEYEGKLAALRTIAT